MNETESQTETGAAALTSAHRAAVCVLSLGGSFALPDRTSPPNRPDAADRWPYPSVRLTRFLLLLSPAKYGPTNRSGVKSVVFIGVETEERIVTGTTTLFFDIS